MPANSGIGTNLPIIAQANAGDVFILQTPNGNTVNIHNGLAWNALLVNPSPSGLTITSGGLTVTAGGITVNGGGETINNAGNLTLNNGANTGFLGWSASTMVLQGTATALTVQTTTSGTLNIISAGALNLQSGGASIWTMPLNTANAFLLQDGTNPTNFILDTRTTTNNVATISFRSAPITLVSASGNNFQCVYIYPLPLTLTGTTTVTNLTGLGLYVDIPTITDASAVTVSKASTFFIGGAPTTSGSVTLTKGWAASIFGPVEIRSGGLVMGLPTGGDTGNGTINVANAVNLNGAAYTNPSHVFEKAYLGKILHPEDPRAAVYEGFPGVNAFEEHVKAVYDLPGFNPKEDVFRRLGFTLERLEEAWLALFDHEHRLTALEGKK